MANPALSPAQQELLDAMRRGVQVTYTPYSLGSGPWYRRMDTQEKCTVTAHSLVKLGLVEIVDRDGRRGHKLRVKGGV